MIRRWMLELQLVNVYRSGRKGFILESCPIYTNGDHHTGNLSHSSLTHPLVLVCFPIASPRQFYLSINHSIFPSGRSITTVESKLNCKADPFFLSYRLRRFTCSSRPSKWHEVCIYGCNWTKVQRRYVSGGNFRTVIFACRR